MRRAATLLLLVAATLFLAAVVVALVPVQAIPVLVRNGKEPQSTAFT